MDPAAHPASVASSLAESAAEGSITELEAERYVDALEASAGPEVATAWAAHLLGAHPTWHGLRIGYGRLLLGAGDAGGQQHLDYAAAHGAVEQVAAAPSPVPPASHAPAPSSHAAAVVIPPAEVDGFDPVQPLPGLGERIAQNRAALAIALVAVLVVLAVGFAVATRGGGKASSAQSGRAVTPTQPTAGNQARPLAGADVPAGMPAGASPAAAPADADQVPQGAEEQPSSDSGSPTPLPLDGEDVQPAADANAAPEAGATNTIPYSAEQKAKVDEGCRKVLGGDLADAGCPISLRCYEQTTPPEVAMQAVAAMTAPPDPYGAALAACMQKAST